MPKKRDYSRRVRPPDYMEKFNAYRRERRRKQNTLAPRHCKHYTDEESVLIGTWSLDNIPTREQAERLGRTPRAIRHIRWKWGLEPPSRDEQSYNEE